MFHVSDVLLVGVTTAVQQDEIPQLLPAVSARRVHQPRPYRVHQVHGVEENSNPLPVQEYIHFCE